MAKIYWFSAPAEAFKQDGMIFRSFQFQILIGTLSVLVTMGTALAKDQSPTPFVKIIHPPSFILPLECTLGANCWVMNYVDMGPDDGKSTDPSCGHRTYDSHKGTDFALLDEATMKRGVNVLAAMDGTVKRVRDGETDRWPTAADIEQVKKDQKECGNAVLIDHGNGLQTIYCHMRRGSIHVKPDQKVKQGDIIGQVGLSGMSEFPHLHFGIDWEGAVIDPFTGQNNTAACSNIKHRMWDKDLVLDYQPLSIQSLGFDIKEPTLEQIEKNAASPTSIPAATEILTLWTTLLGLNSGDLITMTILDPNGKTFTKREIQQTDDKIRAFYYTGRRLRDITLIPGLYTAKITVIRPQENGKEQAWEKITEIKVTP